MLIKKCQIELISIVINNSMVNINWVDVRQQCMETFKIKVFFARVN